MSAHFWFRSIAIAGVLGLIAPSAVAQQIFYEDFRPADEDGTSPCSLTSGGAGTYPFPDGWLLRNVDNATPEAQVAYVNAAWEVRDDFGENGNQCVAFSTSWYSPPGTANDWMWTPVIAIPSTGATLSWRAKAYDPNFRDGYEVRVMVAGLGSPMPGGADGAIGNQLSASTAEFSIDQENSSWTARSLSLARYAGQNIYVAFRNNTADRFLLVVDDIRVVTDQPNLTGNRPAELTRYTRLPTALSTATPVAVQARNNGNIALTEVIASATLLRNGLAVGTPIVSLPVPTLGVGAQVAIQFPGTLPTMNSIGEWTVRYALSCAESAREISVADNQVDATPALIGGPELARYGGNAVVLLGIGAGTGGEVGSEFDLPMATTIVGLHFEMFPFYVDEMNPDNWTGRSVVANLRAFDSGTGKPGDIIATTVGIPTTLEGGKYDLPFATGARTLPAGRYVATVVEPVGGGAMPLPGHIDRFYAHSTWVIWPGIPGSLWAHLEDFGSAYQRMPQVSLLLGLEMFRDGLE